MAAGNRSGRGTGGGADESGSAAAGGLARGSQEGPTRLRPTEGARGRSSGGGTGRVTAAKVRPKDAPKIPGEKSVRRTGATVPVAPPRRSARADEPMPAEAVDHRRQVIGTDDPKTRTTEAPDRAAGNRTGGGGPRGKRGR